MLLRLLSLMCVALLAVSCNKQSRSTNTGFVLSTTQLRDSAEQVIALAPAGAAVEYIGTVPMPTDVHAGPIKVRIDGNEGYIQAALACFGCTPAAIVTDTHPPFLETRAGRFIAYDSVADGNYRIFVASRVSAGWVAGSATSVEPADIAIAAVLERMDSYLKDEGRFEAFENVAAMYSSNPLLQTIKVDLSEAPDDFFTENQKQSGLLFDKKESRIITTSSIATEWISRYLTNVLMAEEGVQTDSRTNYFYKYILSLPKFVNLPAKSVAFSWKMEQNTNPADAYLLYRMDRSAENISSLYAAFKPVIFNIIESDIVMDVRPDADYLIKAYDHIVSIPNHKEVMKKISQEIAQWDREHTNSEGYIDGGYILDDQKDIYQPILNEDLVPDGGYGNTMIWYHSFWVRRFGEGNEKVVYDILKEISQIQRQDASMDQGDGDFTLDDSYNPNDERGDAETGQVDLEAVETFTCTFHEYTMGDCGHLLFSCGDYGDADISELPEEAQEMWRSLAVDGDDGETGNPEYVGKEFVLKVGTTRGPACNEGQGGEGYIPKVLEFRLAN